MKRLFFILAVCLFGLTGCTDKLTADKAKDAVMRGEQDRVPLLLQQMVIVDNITIDSMRITVDSEPMQGYLYTTWRSGKTETPIIVSVTNIHSSTEHKGYTEWESDWESATKAYVLNLFKL